MENVATAKVLVSQHTKVHDGVFAREFQITRPTSPAAAIRVQPMMKFENRTNLPLALIKDHLEKTQPHTEQPQPDVINPQAAQALAHR